MAARVDTLSDLIFATQLHDSIVKISPRDGEKIEMRYGGGRKRNLIFSLPAYLEEEETGNHPRTAMQRLQRGCPLNRAL